MDSVAGDTYNITVKLGQPSNKKAIYSEGFTLRQVIEGVKKSNTTLLEPIIVTTLCRPRLVPLTILLGYLELIEMRGNVTEKRWGNTENTNLN